MDDDQLAMYRQLQKSYQVVEDQMERWNQLKLETTGTLKQAGNLMDQYTACACVDPSETGLDPRAFPDVRARLLAKIQMELETHMSDIRNKLSTLGDISAEVNRQRQLCTQLYQKYWQQMGVAKTCEATAVWPTIAQLMENLHHVDRECHEHVVRLQFCVDEVNYSDEESMQRLRSHWQSRLGRVTDALALVSFLLQDKI